MVTAFEVWNKIKHGVAPDKQEWLLAALINVMTYKQDPPDINAPTPKWDR